MWNLPEDRVSWPKRRYFRSRKTDVCDWEVQVEFTWRQKIWSLTLITSLSACEVGLWTLIWNWKPFRGFLYETAPCNHGDARRTLNNANKLRRFEAAYIDFQLFVCVEDYVGFCKQLILFGFCVWENFRKSTQQRKRLWSMDAIRFPDFFDEKNDWDHTPRGLYFIRWAQF